MDTITKTPRIGGTSGEKEKENGSGSGSGNESGSGIGGISGGSDSRRESGNAGLGVSMKDDIPRRMFQGMPETPSPPRSTRRSSASLGYLGSPLGGSTGPKFVDAPSTTFLGNGRKNSISRDDNNARPRMLPPTTPKSRHNEVFMSPSPKLRSPHVSKDVEKKPIKEVSNELKTRLNYALIKLQNGWVDKTLPELEQALTTSEKENMMMYDIGLHHYNTEHQRAMAEQMNLFMSPQGKRRTSSTYVNQFANESSKSFSIKGMNLRKASRGEDLGTKAVKTEDGTANSSGNEEDNEIEMEDSTDKDYEVNSAHSAFLKALSSPKKRIPTTTQLPVSPLRWTNNKPAPLRLDTSPPTKVDPAEKEIDRDSDNDKDKDTDKPDTSGPPSEVEAIETLMSLASPQKSAGTLEDALVSSSKKRTTPTFLRKTRKEQFKIEARDDHSEHQSDVETEVEE